MKQDLRYLLTEPFDGLNKDTLNVLENVVKDFSVSFSVFCAKNYKVFKVIGCPIVWEGTMNKTYTTEELYDKFVKEIELTYENI
jgi:hypothetical protein